MQPEYTPIQMRRFLAKVDRNGPVPAHRPELGACWLWTGHRNAAGYGLIRIDKVVHLAHRVAYTIATGIHLEYRIGGGSARPSSSKIDICHHCDQRGCVRPSHLFDGNAQTNALDAVSKGRHRVQVHPEKVSRGDSHPLAKLTDAQISEMRRRFSEEQISKSALGREYGISQSYSSQLLNHRVRTHDFDAP